MLSSTGNLRALVADLVLTVIAQASPRGALSPARQCLASLRPIEADDRNMMPQLPDYAGPTHGIVALPLALALWHRHVKSFASLTAVVFLGSTVAIAWHFTSDLAEKEFDVMPCNELA